MQNLKPCPFCGKDAYIGKYEKNNIVKYTIHCVTPFCIANGKNSRLFMTKNAAAEAWNIRLYQEEDE